MYSIEQILSGLKRPELILSELNRQFVNRRNGCRYNPDGFDIFDEDWDNLLILDACRYDFFEKHADLPGYLESRISYASTSSEYIRGNFSNRTLHDVVYVSANGWYAKLKDDINAEIHQFSFVERDAKNGLTSHPETVAKDIRQHASEYPNKRLIGHFMQPHQPFLGPTAEKFNQRRGLGKTVKHSDVTREDIVRAYTENLNLVLDEVKSLVKELSGRTVITADHGEIFGKAGYPIPVKRYGHPPGQYLNELVKVPWHVIESDTRREIIAEPPQDSNNLDFSEVEKHLANLGYRT